jgi:hypothetical protein
MGESGKYATLTMKAAILDKGDIILPSGLKRSSMFYEKLVLIHETI